MSDAPQPAVEIRGLTKDFPLNLRGLRLRAVDDLTLEIPRGCVHGLLGPNGSGKSTTIKVLLGLLRRTRGTCRVLGCESDDPAVRARIGYLPESPDFHRFLTGRELVRYYARLCGVARAGREARAAEMLEWVGLTAAADRRIGSYSKGMLQRVGLAQALVHDPELVILDEPTAGVDPVGSADIVRLILKLKEAGKTVLVTSHLLAQAEDVCDRIAILNRGKLIAAGTVDQLVSRSGALSFVVEGMPPDAVGELRAWLDTRGWRLASAGPHRSRLDELFLERIRKSEEGA
ncbi:MAG TPA: ABC transporter ATP-binding protein [Opitutaceae bacterium]